MKNVLRGLYYYYSYGSTSGVQYLKTLTVLLLIIFIHFMQLRMALLTYFNFKVNLPFVGSGRFIQYLVILILISPFYLALRILLPEKTLRDHNLSREKMIRGHNIFFIYALINICILCVLVWPYMKFKQQ